MPTEYRLSYPVDTVCWTDGFIRPLPPEQYEPKIRAIKAAGVDALMLTGYVTVEPAAFDVDEETKRLGGFLDSLGMCAAQHHGLCATWAPAGESQDEVVENIVKCARWTANLGSKVLVIHPGNSIARLGTIAAYDKAFHEEMARIGRTEIMRLMARNVDAAAEEARAFGVSVAMENVHFFNEDNTLLPDLFAEVHSTNAGYCIDFGHAHYAGGGVDYWLDKLGDRILTTHIHDNRGRDDEHRPPGFGTIPWPDVIACLRALGYEGYANFESGPWELPDMVDGYRHAIDYWRACERIADER